MLLAAKHIWWETPDDAIQFPNRIIAQVMDIGDYDEVLVLIKSVGEDDLRKVLTNAEVSQFRPRSWHYWHYRLGLSEITRTNTTDAEKESIISITDSVDFFPYL